MPAKLTVFVLKYKFTKKKKDFMFWKLRPVINCLIIKQKYSDK